MHASMNRPHNSNGPLFRNTLKAAAKLTAICLIAIAVPLALYVRVKSKGAPTSTAAATSSKRTKDTVTVHAAGRGKPFLNLQDGRERVVTYKGDQAAVAALQSGAAQPRALASADFDHNGTPD